MAATAVLDFVRTIRQDCFRTPFSVSMKKFVRIRAIVTELWALNGIQNSSRRHLEFTSILVTWPNFLPNFVNISQPAAELLRFVEKFKMAVSAILNYYLVILDHPQSLVCGPEVAHQIWCWSNLYLVKISYLKICQFGLKCLFRPTKFTFWGF